MEGTGEHRVPSLNPGEIILFLSFVRAGVSLPGSTFLHHFLHYFNIRLHDLTPNEVLHVSVFVHFCEAFLGIHPSITLFCYLFRLKPHPKTDSTSIMGGCGIQFRQGKQKEFSEYTLVESFKEWCAEWFYAGNLRPPLAVHLDAGPVPNDQWEKLTVTAEEL